MNQKTGAKYGTLYLIPTPLGDAAWSAIPAEAIAQLHASQYLVAENAKTARRFMRSSGFTAPLEPIQIEELNEHTPAKEVSALLQPLLDGHDMGLLSEAGLPCVADPGHQLVRLAHDKGIKVHPMTGPSSLMLALMASGLNGQQFAFAGYLPADSGLLAQKLTQIEQIAQHSGQTQIWIETPYRNTKMLAAALKTLRSETRLCVAVDLCMPSEWILSASVANWRKTATPDLHKRPAVWLLGR